MQIIGEKLKNLRKDRGLTQKDLADNAGVTGGMISIMESNKVSPSVATLMKVLSALNVSPGEFFQQDSTVTKKFFFNDDELINIGTGNIILKLVGGKNAGCEIGLLKETYPPGSDTGSEMISFEGQEGGFIIQGEIEVTIGDQKQILKSGQAYYFDTSIPHRFQNLSKEVCEIISASTYHQ
jgi:transcriptional regulator with XRE-family HTH domain